MVSKCVASEGKLLKGVVTKRESMSCRLRKSVVALSKPTNCAATKGKSTNSRLIEGDNRFNLSETMVNLSN